MTDPYSVLGVGRDATDEQIKSAYRKLAMEHHPDRNGGSNEAAVRFKEIQSAYDQVKSAEKRAAFEQSQRPQQNPFHDFGNFGFQFHTGGMDDLFRNFGMRPREQNRHFNTHCTISFNDAFHGCDITMHVSGNPGHDINVRIPAGVDNNTRIRVPGMGENRFAHQPPGDLFITVSVTPDPRFQRDGDNIVTEVSIDAIDLMLTERFRTMTIDGDEVEISVPGGSIISGSKLRLAGRGLPNVHTQQRGDHIVVVMLRTAALTERQREFLKQIKSLPE